MSRFSSNFTDSPPDPEELPADGSSFPAGMVLLALIAYYFSGVLPVWKPLVWWFLVFSTGTFRIWMIKRSDFSTMSDNGRRWLLRGLIWLFIAAISTSTYFLYVPANIELQAMLTVYLIGTAIISIAHLTGVDWIRIFVVMLILAAPNGIHLIYEGITLGHRVTWVLGCCTLFLPFPLAQISVVQSRLMLKQFESRLEAEGSARAMNAIAQAKSRFFAAISHDLRQPVHAIGLYLDAIERVVAESNNVQAKHAVQGITLSWQTLNDLLSQVLDLARLEANMEQPELRFFYLAPLIQELMMQHSAVAERSGVRLIALVKPDCQVYADALMLKRVLSNLIGNALKYSPQGSVVVVALRRTSGLWKIQVRDAGCGISDEDQAQIFSEFVQLNNKSRDPSQGLGLGLAIAKRLIELLGGKIAVRSRLGEGCCMTVSLPYAVPEISSSKTSTSEAATIALAEPVLKPEQMPIAAANLRGLRVLLLEDDVLVGKGMHLLLRSWGCEVAWAQTAAVARQHASACDLAICDVRLPDNESGLDFAAWLQTIEIPVMLITGETDLAPRDFAAQRAIPLLTKPVSSKELKKALDRLASA